MSSAYLKESRVEKIKSGFLWIFRNDLKKKPPGEGVVDVLDNRGRFVGKGYYNPKSKISIRMLTYSREEVGRELFLKRVLAAKRLRDSVYPGFSMYRAFYSEGDLISGLVVDRYGDILSVQVLSKAVEYFWNEIEGILDEVFSPKEIIRRDDSPARSQEGMEIREHEDSLTVEVEEFGIRYLVDVKRGHKTGFYLDQKDNRFMLRTMAAGKRVLDIFSYIGAWSMNALKGGVKEVWAIDISKRVLDVFKENVRLNGFPMEKVKLLKGDAFDTVKELFKSGERFDIVVNDPPAFAKKDADVNGAKRGYKYMNLYSLKLLKPGGLLFTFSCSQHMGEDMLFETLMDAARDAGKKIKLLKRLSQSLDHPVNPAMPETFYLKGFLVEVS